MRRIPFRHCFDYRSLVLIALRWHRHSSVSSGNDWYGSTVLAARSQRFHVRFTWKGSLLEKVCSRNFDKAEDAPTAALAAVKADGASSNCWKFTGRYATKLLRKASWRFGNPP